MHKLSIYATIMEKHKNNIQSKPNNKISATTSRACGDGTWGVDVMVIW
jgi:hypothetical protein